MRRIILLSIFISLLLFTVAAYSVSISLSSDNVAQLGGTGNVEVKCPVAGDPCKIDKVKWVISRSPPYEVSAVEVTWTPASLSATYTVYVTLYNNNNEVIAYGSASQSGSDSQVTTTVDISPASPSNKVLPKDVYYVEIVIVQTDWTKKL